MTIWKPSNLILGSALLAALLAACGGSTAASSPAAVATVASAKPSASTAASPSIATVASASTVPVGASTSAAAKPSAAGSAAAAPSVPASVTLMVETSSTLGKVLANAQGKTLYTRVNDKPDGSGCTGGCLGVWPPLYSASVPAAPTGFTQPLALGTRGDNSAKQVMVGNFPVYTFASDQNPGDAKGEGVGDPQTWHAVKVS